MLGGGQSVKVRVVARNANGDQCKVATGTSADLEQKERWLVLNKLDLLPEKEAEKRCKEIVRRLRWRGPVYRISALAKQGTEPLCRDVMKRLEELGIQEPEGDSG